MATMAKRKRKTRQPKHTPGPWGLREDTLGCKQVCRIGQYPDGEFFTLSEIGYTHGLADEDEDAANASLICAAPDLLAAAIAALERYDACIADPQFGDEMQELREAVAKAIED